MSVESEQDVLVIAAGKPEAAPNVTPRDDADPATGATLSSLSSHLTYLVEPSMVMAVPSGIEKAGNHLVSASQLASKLV